MSENHERLREFVVHYTAKHEPVEVDARPGSLARRADLSSESPALGISHYADTFRVETTPVEPVTAVELDKPIYQEVDVFLPENKVGDLRRHELVELLVKGQFRIGIGRPCDPLLCVLG